MSVLAAFSAYNLQPTQQAWLLEELRRHPILAGQSPHEWLLWRTQVAGGLSEADAWDFVVRSRARQPEAVTQPNMSAPVYGWSPTSEGGQDVGGVAGGVYSNGTIDPSQLLSPGQGGQPRQQASQQQAFSSIANGQQHGYASQSDAAMAGYCQPSMHDYGNMQSPPPTSLYEGVKAERSDDASYPSIKMESPPSKGSKRTIPVGSSQSPELGTNAQLSPSSSIVVDVKTEPSRVQSPFMTVAPGSIATRSPSPFFRGPSPLLKREFVEIQSAEPGQSSKKVRLDSSSIGPPQPVIPPQQKNPETKSSLPSSSAGAGPSKPVTYPPTMHTIRQLITREKLQSDKPMVLFKHLRTRPTPDGKSVPDFNPTPDDLKEIMLALWNFASKPYLQQMADKEPYTRLFTRWMKLFLNKPEKWGVAMGPLLNVLAKTDMPVNYMTDEELKIGKLAKQVSQKAVEAKIPQQEEIQAAFRNYQSWVKDVLLVKNRRVPLPGDEDPAPKKPKLEPVNSASQAGPSKPVSGTQAKPGPSTLPAKTAGNANTKAPSPAAPKADMSFFGAGPSSSTPASSAYKPRKPLPDIKKTSGATTTTSSAASLLSATMAALQGQGRGRLISPPPPQSGGSGTNLSFATLGENKVKPNKKGHTVRFRDTVPDGGALEQVKEFTEPAFEHEIPYWIDVDAVSGKSSHQLDMDEGQALRKHGHEELVEVVPWYDPPEYEQNLEQSIKPISTPETQAQEARERGILAVNYYNDIPPTADETSTRFVDFGPSTVRFTPRVSETKAVAQSAHVLDLLGKLDASKLSEVGASAPGAAPFGTFGGAMGYQAQSQPPIQPTGGYGGYQPYPPAGAAPQSQGYGYGYQQSSTPAHTQTQAPYAFQGSNPNPASQWNMDHSHNAGGSGGGYGRDRGPDRTWGGQAASREYPGYGGGGGGGDRGDRGDRKGKKTVQCKFWLNKDCVKGDKCTFRHD